LEKVIVFIHTKYDCFQFDVIKYTCIECRNEMVDCMFAFCINFTALKSFKALMQMTVVQRDPVNSGRCSLPPKNKNYYG